MSKSPKGDPALWDRTKTLVKAGGLENMIEILMDETGWTEKQARKYAGLALKHCAVEFHAAKSSADRTQGFIWIAVALALFAAIQAAIHYLNEKLFLAPPIIMSYGVYLLLRSMKTAGTVNKARHNLPPPPHEQP